MSDSVETRKILRDFLKGLVFILIIILITIAIEHTDTGERLTYLGYEYLQSYLSPHDLPIAVVDISELRPERIDVDEIPREVTPRKELKELIEAISHQGAKAIGVDINFAPLSDGRPLTPDDAAFFQFCLDLQKAKGTPIALAVAWARKGESISRTPELLIENEAYKNLFAVITNPRDPVKMPYQVAYKKDKEEIRAQTMSAALARALPVPRGGSPFSLELPGWMASQFSVKKEGGMEWTEFLVDYSVIQSFHSRDNTLRPGTVDIVQKQGSILRDKVVLIGDVSPGEDQFMIPGQRGELFQGVYLHASAIYTLAEAPLLKVKKLGALLLDFILAFIILAAVSAIRWYFRSSNRKVAKHRLEKLFTFLVAVSAFIVAVWFVGSHRVMWADFVIVIPMLFLHRPIEEFLLSAWSFLRRRTPQAVEAVVFEEKGTEDR
jgi:CHASE2 domain-containing sensor protein